MIVIGDEILNGRTKDLNGSWLAKFLFKKGVELKSVRFIKDDTHEIEEALAHSMNESDIIITSGGIGPTIDDKTKKTLATFYKKKIILRDDVADIVRENYLRFGREWVQESNYYHHFPEDFEGVLNPKGLAPGLLYLTPEHKLILSAPGVPREFMAMVEEEFFPKISTLFKEKIKENFQTVVRTEGIPEEKIFFELCPTLWKDLEHFGKVSSLPHTLGIDIVISYTGTTKIHHEISEQIKAYILKTPLSPHVWQFGNASLPELVLALAKKEKVTFSFAESCTGGLLSSKITDLSGASDVFHGGVVAYDNKIKINLLNVDQSVLNKFGAVSKEVAVQMAVGLLNNFQTDYAISITGIAGPAGGTKEKPVGTVAIGYATKNKNGAYLFSFPGDRIKLKDRFSDKALLVLLELLKTS